MIKMPDETILREKNDSIVVKRNFKGKFGWEAKVTYDNTTENVDDVIAQLVHINNSLKERFL